MAVGPAGLQKVIPAQLSFLAIYNPCLGPTDDTFRNQIVFYHSRATHARRKHRTHNEQDDDDTKDKLREEENEKLRQIGLAQGMVGFAKGFANGQNIDSVETEKSRIVLKEVEEGWWMLASIELTRLPSLSPPASSKTGTKPSSEPQSPVEYSSREVSPPDLLLEQLLRAHRIFRLHHGLSLSNLLSRMQRTRFCNLLEKYWTRFAVEWDVLLHGNPAVDMYVGMKLAAGGELGIGVGEEEWGSGEREVFEDFAGRTDGLADMIVSRFGELSQEQRASPAESKISTPGQGNDRSDAMPWMGMATSPGPADGVVFSGIGALAKSSLVDVSDWIQGLYYYGEHAYGVRDRPGSDQRRRGRQGVAQYHRQSSSSKPDRPTRRTNRSTSTREHPTIPPPIVAAAERSLERASAAADAGKKDDNSAATQSQDDTPGDPWTKYLTLGYGTAWGLGSGKTQEPKHELDSASAQDEAAVKTRSRASTLRHVDPEPEGRRYQEKIDAQIRMEQSGHFLIGLKGGLSDAEGFDSHNDSDEDDERGGSRTLVRTLYVELSRPPTPARQVSSTLRESGDSAHRGGQKPTRLRVVVYVQRPFIYTFLFHSGTEALAMPSFYRNIHTFFGPLHRLLSNSTSPSNVASRISVASPQANMLGAPSKAASTKDAGQQPIFDLMYDPKTMVLHTSIPNIPDPGTVGAEGLSLPTASGPSTSLPPWTRVEALNVHSQILTTINATRKPEVDSTTDERTAKTSRGWWVVWMRFHTLHAPDKAEGESTVADEPITEPDHEEAEQVAASEDASGRTLISSSSQSALQPSPTSPARDHTFSKAALSMSREAILIRRARDAASGPSKSSARTTSGMWSFGLGGTGMTSLRGGSGRDDPTGGEAAGWGPARLAEGIGVDARRYVEGLLSLNR